MKRWMGLLTVGLYLLAGATAWAGTRTITVTGTVDDAQAAVSVNGVAATVTADGTFTAGVTLQEGANTITATATDAAGNRASDAVTVTLDTVPPAVRITSPKNGDIIGSQ